MTRRSASAITAAMSARARRAGSAISAASRPRALLGVSQVAKATSSTNARSTACPRPVMIGTGAGAYCASYRAHPLSRHKPGAVTASTDDEEDVGTGIAPRRGSVDGGGDFTRGLRTLETRAGMEVTMTIPARCQRASSPAISAIPRGTRRVDQRHPGHVGGDRQAGAGRRRGPRA